LFNTCNIDVSKCTPCPLYDRGNNTCAKEYHEANNARNRLDYPAFIKAEQALVDRLMSMPTDEFYGNFYGTEEKTLRFKVGDVAWWDGCGPGINPPRAPQEVRIFSVLGIKVNRCDYCIEFGGNDDTRFVREDNLTAIKKKKEPVVSPLAKYVQKKDTNYYYYMGVLQGCYTYVLTYNIPARRTDVSKLTNPLDDFLLGNLWSNVCNDLYFSDVDIDTITEQFTAFCNQLVRGGK